ncbi:MAG: hypothetical protein IJY39_04370 [Clostridia bacterium]|nr:hypothetical protein [Clostridia bacterium]
MNFESYKQLLLCPRDKDISLRTGKSYSLDFELDDEKSADRIFFTGEVGFFYQWKTEPDYKYLYRRPDDSLSSIEANRSQYALDMSADNFNYPKIAHKKIVWWPRFYGGGANWDFGLSVKAEDLKLHEGGYLHFLIEVRLIKEGVDKRIAYTEPDVTAKIDLPEGSYDWTELVTDVKFNAGQVANVCVYLEGEHYSGRVFCESPFLRTAGFGENILADFSIFTEDKKDFNWIGVNLSKKETPSLCIELNGVKIHDGEIFERCHRYSEWEVTIPRGVAKRGLNTVTFTHTSDYRDAPPYNLHEVGVVSVRRDSLIACPEVVTAGKPFAVLVKTDRDNAEYTLESIDGAITAASPLVCKEAGLNVLHLICNKAKNDIDFVLICGDSRIECRIARSVVREEDGVCTGTGDAVYVNQNDTDFENYLSWYLSNNVGNLITFRPTYRWSGSKAADGRLWRKTADLLDELDMKYVHMLDGREHQGGDANPRKSELASDHFLGRQTHELDGQFVYWGMGGTADPTNNVNEQMFYDLFVRMFQKDPERTNMRFTPDTYKAAAGKLEICRDYGVKRDMEAMASFVVNGLASCRYDSTRHTGPATLFKYFYQAGYSWTGAELMYGTTEVTNSVLRGAAKVYGGAKGAHLATQWSTTPHDTDEHAKRYRLALYTAYMEDLDDINTEEGLWRMEEYFAYHNRHSKACLSHLKQHQDFYRYLSTHTRSGSFYTPVAFLHGRFDGWKLFGAKNSTWGRLDCPYTDAENAWDMLDAFYPHSKTGAIYRHGCPKDRPIGHYSGTPSGSIDVIPIEAKDYSEYPLLCSIGYNKALDEDMDKLSAYVNGGGRLFIGLPQLSVTTDRTAIENYELKYTDHPFARQIATFGDFVEDSFEGNKVRVCSSIPEKATVLEKTDGGKALIYALDVGKGTAIVLNTLEYAGNSAIYELVKKTLKALGDEVFNQEKIWAEGDDVVQFTAYKQENGDMHFYFLSTDWYCSDEPERIAKLRIGENKYDVNINFGRMIKAVVSKDVGAWFDGEDCDVLSICNGAVSVQGIGQGRLFIAKDGEVRQLSVDFTEASVQSLQI